MFGNYYFYDALEPLADVLQKQLHFTDQNITWLKYYDSGAARVISVSVDGYNWSQLVSLATTDFVTPNQIGIALNANCGYSSSWGTADTGMTLLHWKQY